MKKKTSVVEYVGILVVLFLMNPSPLPSPSSGNTISLPTSSPWTYSNLKCSSLVVDECIRERKSVGWSSKIDGFVNIGGFGGKNSVEQKRHRSAPNFGGRRFGNRESEVLPPISPSKTKRCVKSVVYLTITSEEEEVCGGDEEDHDHCLLHCCFHWCALCQEDREMKARVAQDMFKPITIVKPPVFQDMNWN